MRASLPDLSNKEVVHRFSELDDELEFMKTLVSLDAKDQSDSNYKNFILIFGEDGELPPNILTFRHATDALKKLFQLENESSKQDIDIVLVKGETGEDIREAFKNYFSDASNFVELIEKGCTNYKKWCIQDE